MTKYCLTTLDLLIVLAVVQNPIPNNTPPTALLIGNIIESRTPKKTGLTCINGSNMFRRKVAN